MAKIRTGGAASTTDRTRTQISREKKETGEIGERSAVRVLKELGFDRAGLGLHYGPNQGIDAYGIRNTPRGRTVAFMEAKATADPNKRGTEKEILGLLETDRKGLQQGSPLWNEDRLREAHRRGSRVATYIRSGQARAGDGRIWQTRHYVHWKNIATGEEKTFRLISSKAISRVDRIKLISHKLPK